MVRSAFLKASSEIRPSSNEFYKHRVDHCVFMPEQITEKHNLKTDATALEEHLETDKLANRLKFHLGLEPVTVIDEAGSKRKVWRERDHNLLNKRGVENIVGLVRGIVDKNQTTSIYSDREIKRVMKSLHRAVAREITENWTLYGIGKRGTADKVMEIVTDNCYSAFKRARNGKTLDVIGDTTETVSKTRQEKDKKSSTFSL